VKTLKAILALALAIVSMSSFAADEPDNAPAVTVPDNAPAVTVLDTAPAMKVADAWLASVDAGRYTQSWDDAADYFRAAVPKAQWEQTLATVRAPLGVPISRKLRSATYAKALPGAPTGEYVVIQYDTGFENRPLSVETITSMHEKDGSWKVAGYLIR
jgi:Protein of unknown function (DUF4019)